MNSWVIRRPGPPRTQLCTEEKSFASVHTEMTRSSQSHKSQADRWLGMLTYQFTKRNSFPEEHNTGARGLLFFKLKHLLKAYHAPRPVQGPFTWAVSFQPQNKPLKHLLCPCWSEGGCGLGSLRAPAEVTERSGGLGLQYWGQGSQRWQSVKFRSGWRQSRVILRWQSLNL